MSNGIGIEKGQPLWYKDAVIYELHVKAFYDGNGDGIGDFQGLIEKLDYLKELGITAVWLLPFYPSPLKDDGYDISDYFDVHPDYGTLREFRQFLKEAHARGIRVITELVINHTSDQHQWFQRARRAKPGSRLRDLYVWSDTPEKYKDAKVIFPDFEHSNWAWDPVANAYYWHRFFSHQPNLNFDSPVVQKEIFRVVDFWLGMGVDGMRLDAIPYLFQREGTSCENLPETHAFIRELRAHIDSRFDDRMLLAEANMWPEDAATYFGKGDECHMAFHFPVMPRLFMAVQMEDRFPIIDMLEQSRDIPDSCQWAMFLRNHDELALEMVTDEERDYMYQTYARDPRSRVHAGIRRRLAPLLENNRRKMELLDFLLFSLPGTPVVYYGDEIGMGDNYYLGDRNGVRTPMQWTPDRNAGFSNANPQRLYLPVVIDSLYHYTAVNVENQTANLSSLMWFTRRLVAVRNRYAVFGRGRIEFVASDNARVLTFIRQLDDVAILVVANLSRFCQVARLELSRYSGCVPEELFGGNEFPQVNDKPYTLTMGPHNAFWFELKPAGKTVKQVAGQIPEVSLDVAWEDIADGESRYELAEVMAEYIKTCSWFGGRDRLIQAISIADSISIGGGEQLTHLLMVRVSYRAMPDELYMIPVSLESHDRVGSILSEPAQCAIAHLQLRDRRGLLFDGTCSSAVQDELLEMIRDKRSVRKNGAVLAGSRGSRLKELLSGAPPELKGRVLRGRFANTSIIYGDSLVLKLYCRPASGPNPEVEISRYLTERSSFAHCPTYAGVLEWRSEALGTMVVGILTQYVPHESNAWAHSLDSFELYASRAAASKQLINGLCDDTRAGGRDAAIPETARELIGPFYLEMAALLGKRTAQMHLALASFTESEDSGPQPFSVNYQKAIYQSMRSLALRVMAGLEQQLPDLPAPIAKDAQRLLTYRQDILNCFRNITKKKVTGARIRIHGDYHLAQVLYRGKDFVITDFEGEAAAPLGERRLKRSVLRDVAGMMRSFHYAAHSAIIQKPLGHLGEAEELTKWAGLWYYYVSGAFLNAYRQEVGEASFLPQDEDDMRVLLDAFLLNRAIYEFGCELREMPQRLPMIVGGIEQILGK